MNNYKSELSPALNNLLKRSMENLDERERKLVRNFFEEESRHFCEECEMLAEPL